MDRIRVFTRSGYLFWYFLRWWFIVALRRNGLADNPKTTLVHRMTTGTCAVFLMSSNYRNQRTSLSSLLTDTIKRPSPHQKLQLPCKHGISVWCPRCSGQILVWSIDSYLERGPLPWRCIINYSQFCSLFVLPSEGCNVQFYLWSQCCNFLNYALLQLLLHNSMVLL